MQDNFGLQSSSPAYLDIPEVRDIIEESALELARVEAESTEISVLVKQTQAELERLEPRVAQVSRMVHEVENQPDSHTRAEIREAYSAAQEAQMRSFVMQGQLEQLNHKKAILQRYEGHLRHLLTALNCSPEMGEAIVSTRVVESSPVRAVDHMSPPVVAENGDFSLAKVIEAQEREKYLMSQEIHDGPAQVLSNLALRAEVCERLLMSNDERAVEEMRQIKKSIANSLRNTRELIYELRPVVLGEIGLHGTVQKYIETLAEKRKIALTVECDPIERDLSESTEIALFRIIQETVGLSLANTKISHLIVRMSASDAGLILMVEDDGGSDPGDQGRAGRPFEQNPKLTGLRERLQLLGAMAETGTAENGGSVVRLTIPWPRQ